ncbi:hypothetical protein [Alicycliphilus denitrificans]|uniref:hypothetical protein n=1 Tax=Alicycliphilus denitrificans TaxID=179636 RepID=UPI003A7F6904
MPDTPSRTHPPATQAPGAAPRTRLVLRRPDPAAKAPPRRARRRRARPRRGPRRRPTGACA